MAQRHRIVRALLFVLLVAGGVGVALPALLFSSAEGWRVDTGAGRYVGGVLAITGVALYLACVAHLTRHGTGMPTPGSPATELVRSGPFRVVRNPMYVAGTLFFWGLALASGSLVLLAYVFVMSLVYYPFLVRMEERQLATRFGAAYATYCAGTPRWLPALRWGTLRRRPS